MLKFYLIIVCLMFFFCGCNNRKDVFTYYKEGNKKYVYDYVKSGNNICIKQTEIENEITLFTFAVIEEDDELCDLILKNKTFSLEFELSQEGYTALHAIAAHGKNSLLKKIFPRIKNINISDGTTPLTPLGYALLGNNYETMSIILSHKSVNVNYVNPLDQTKSTISHIAGRKGDLKALKLLRKYGADFSIKNSNGEDVKNFVLRYLEQKLYLNKDKENALNCVVEYLSKNNHL